MSEVSFVPFWYEPLKLHEQHGPGFGVDFHTWHWCEWARLARVAEALSEDEDAFKFLDRETVPTAPVAPETRNARAAILAKRNKTPAS